MVMDNDVTTEHQVSGETMRDRFAMAALSWILSNSEWYEGTWMNTALAAYKAADAMIAAREVQS
jgi:hypothetical protein